MVKVAKLDPRQDEVETLLENCKHQGYDGVIVFGFTGNDFETHNTRFNDLLSVLGALGRAEHYLNHVIDEAEEEEL